MTRVDFYILQDVDITAMQRFACRLACKAVDSGQQVVVHAADENSARAFDALLWEYPEQRFLPHGIERTPEAEGAPVVVSWGEPKRYDGVLINLTPGVPDFFGRFERVAEIVVGSSRDEGRARYQFYRDRGFPLYHHELDDWEG